MEWLEWMDEEDIEDEEYVENEEDVEDEEDVEVGEEYYYADAVSLCSLSPCVSCAG